MKISGTFAVFILVGSSLTNAATLAGTGTLNVSNSVAGAGGTFFFNVTDAIPEGSISYNIVVADPNGDAVFNGDARGFGEVGGAGNQFNNGTDTLEFTIANLTITPAIGFSVQSQNIHFDSFVLSANGVNPPSVNWTTPENVIGGTTNTGANPSTTLETGVDGGSSISLTAATNWSWINDAATSYTVEFVPEPSSAFLGFLGLSLLARRKR